MTIENNGDSGLQFATPKNELPKVPDIIVNGPNVHSSVHLKGQRNPLMEVEASSERVRLREEIDDVKWQRFTRVVSEITQRFSRNNQSDWLRENVDQQSSIFSRSVPILLVNWVNEQSEIDWRNEPVRSCAIYDEITRRLGEN